MSDINDFVIKNKKLQTYTGDGGDVARLREGETQDQTKRNFMRSSFQTVEKAVRPQETKARK